jgi:hypothetical protein
MIASRRMRLTGHLEIMRRRGIYMGFLVGKPEG